jgi:hypothetical protein
VIWEGLAVEIIRILWDHGLYRDNPWLQKVHATWFNHWVDYKTGLTMDDVNRQIEEMFEESKVMPPIYWEQEKGETPLGGPIGYTYDFVDDEPSGSDTVQRPEQRPSDG